MDNWLGGILRTAAAAGSVLAWSGSGIAAVESDGWFDRPMRWAQLTLVENDPGQYDPKFWLDYFKRTHSDATCLSAGGCVAYYPTKIPLQKRSRFLGDRDPFGDMVKGCRALGMNIVARTDPHAAHQGIYDAHPDWIAVEANGQKRRHWANPELWVTCALGPFNWDFMTEIHREIVSTYPVDAIFSNRWAGHGQCFCEHCRANFKNATGHELPTTSDPQDPARRAYILWRQQRLFEVAWRWDTAIKKINPNGAFIPNSGGGALSDLDMKALGDMAPILFADRQARRGLMPAWAAGKNAKEYRAAMGRKPIAGITSVGVEEPYRWKDSVQDGHEIRLWMADGIAHNLRPWFVKFNAKVDDRRWVEPIARLYEWHHANEYYLRNEQPIARVGMVYSQQTAWYYGGQQAHSKVEDHTLGFYQALVEARIPFEMVHDRKLGDVQQFRTLILPNIAALSDEQCMQLERFVRSGGSIVATHETSLYDEWGKRRREFGLSRLFGASYAGGYDARMQNSYLNLAHPHPLLRGLEDTPRIINGTARVHTTALADALPAPITLLPTFPDLPMEDVYPRVAKTDIPGVHLRQAGRGRVVYFPFDLDRTFWEVLSPDHFKLLRNAVEWATDEPPVITVEGKGLLDISVWRQEHSITVHIVNLTNPMAMKGPVREFIPAPPQQVSIRIPEGRAPRAIRLLVSGQTRDVDASQRVVRLTTPPILDHEVVAVDF